MTFLVHFFVDSWALKYIFFKFLNRTVYYFTPSYLFLFIIYFRSNIEERVHGNADVLTPRDV